MGKKARFDHDEAFSQGNCLSKPNPKDGMVGRSTGHAIGDGVLPQQPPYLAGMLPLLHRCVALRLLFFPAPLDRRLWRAIYTADDVADEQFGGVLFYYLQQFHP